MPSSATDQKSRYDIRSLVYAQNYASENKWYSGRVTELIQSTIFMILTDRKVWKRHLIQLQPRFGVFESTGTNLNNDSQPRNTSIAVQTPNEPKNPLDAAPISRRYLTRSRRPPDCYRSGFRRRLLCTYVLVLVLYFFIVPICARRSVINLTFSGIPWPKAESNKLFVT